MEIQGLGNIEGGLFNGSNQFFSADLKTTLIFLENYGLKFEDIILNSMDFFSVSTDVVDGKVKFMRPTAIDYITKEKPLACAWDPVGGLTYERAEATLCPHNIQMENCPDVVPCWESLFGQGNDIESWSATPMGRHLMQDLVKGTFDGIGNDLFKIAMLGSHPIITDAEADFSGDPEFYSRLKRTLSVCGGWFTMIDELASTRGGQWAVGIDDSEFNGEEYTGDPEELFKKLKAAMSPKFRQIAKQWKSRGVRPCILVTHSIYQAYVDKLKATYNAFPDMLYYRMSNEFTAANGLNNQAPAPGILGWDDFWVKEIDALDVIAGDIEVIHHRATMTMPKVFCIGLDVKGVTKQYGGMGLRIESSPMLKDGGKVYMSTNYRMGTALSTTDLIVNAHRWVKAA